MEMNTLRLYTTGSNAYEEHQHATELNMRWIFPWNLLEKPN